MSYVAKIITATALLSVLSACSMQELREEFPVFNGWNKATENVKPTVARPLETTGDNVANILRYYHQLGGLTLDQLHAEWEDARRQFEKDRDDSARMRLAMIALRPNTDMQNLALAGELLRDYRDRQSAGRDREALAVLLNDMVNEQLKLVELKRMAIAQLEKLQDQINALKNIEQNIHERELRDSGAKKR
ncbi:MAG: CorA family divalent cation transporter [Gammaproteobacteria bacterium]|nr:CorA family divalent cation transporter [Gammaproteobacteria bacterium]